MIPSIHLRWETIVRIDIVSILELQPCTVNAVRRKPSRLGRHRRSNSNTYGMSFNGVFTTSRTLPLGYCPTAEQLVLGHVRYFTAVATSWQCVKYSVRVSRISGCGPSAGSANAAAGRTVVRRIENRRFYSNRMYNLGRPGDGNGQIITPILL